MKRRHYIASLGSSAILLSGCSLSSSSRKNWDTTLFDPRSLAIRPPIDVYNGTIWALNTEGSLFGISTSDGDTSYDQEITRGAVTGPQIQDGKGYLGFRDLHWGEARQDGTWSSVDSVRLPGRQTITALSVDSSNAYVGLIETGIWCVSRETGDTEWKALDESKYVLSTSLENDILISYGTSQDGWVIAAISPSDGHVQWRKTYQNVTDLSMSEGSLYITHDDKITSLSIPDGERRWRRTIGQAQSVFTNNSPVCVVTEGASAAEITALSESDGSRLWQSRIDESVGDQALSTIADGQIFISLSGNRVSALDVESGDKQWAFKFNSDRPIVADPIYSRGNIFVCRNNSVVSLDA